MFIISKYDNKLKYDFNSKTNGLRYDYTTFKVIINLFEVLKLSQASYEIFFHILLKDKFSLFDINEAMMHKNFSDTINFNDYQNANALIPVLEQLDILEQFIYISANLYLTETNFNIADDAKAFNLIVSNDKFNLQDISDLRVFKEILENNKLLELSRLVALVENFEELDLTETPRTAESDYYIGRSNNIDPRFINCLVPFDLIIDPVKSTFDVMPPTQTISQEIPYLDGEIDVHTVYQSRLYNIVAYSIHGLTVAQKEAMKTKIVNLLDETKNKTKKFTFGKNNLTFDAKYVGGSNTIQEGPSFIKAEIPFKLSPYGYNQFTKIFEGNGVIVNDGKTDLGAVITISSGCTNPNFLIGDKEFLWIGVVPSGKKLIIDNEDTNCYLVDDFGIQTQAMTQLTKGRRFKTVPKNSSATLTCLNPSTLNCISTEYSPKYLWAEIEGENDEPTGQNFNVLRT